MLRRCATPPLAQRNGNMRRILLIISIAVLYVLAVSLALKYLPSYEAPQFFKLLFTKNSNGSLVWAKVRHFAVVGAVGSLLALSLVRHMKETAQIDGFVIGTLAVTWGFLFRWRMIGTSGAGWIEITDYLIIWLAIPLCITILMRLARHSNRH